MRKLWTWMNTPFAELPWTYTLFVGVLAGIVLGFVLALVFELTVAGNLT